MVLRLEILEETSILVIGNLLKIPILMGNNHDTAGSEFVHPKKIYFYYYFVIDVVILLFIYYFHIDKHEQLSNYNFLCETNIKQSQV